MIPDQVLTGLEAFASPSDATFLQRFFKTGEGQYGAGDVFIGVRVPQVRQVAATFKTASAADIAAILESPIHEMRLCGLVIMTLQAKRADSETHKALLDLYLQNTDRINNWDLVDLSCRDVVGAYVLKHPHETRLLYRLAKSSDLWERRIAMISCWTLIRDGQLDVPFDIATILLTDKHDLIQKAVGWMLRDMGDKNRERQQAFLTRHIGEIPRTALRYAIEHFAPEERQYYLKLQ